MATNRQVLIVGAGPVGLTLANALIRRGVRVQIYEARDKLDSQDRAATFHPPTLEIFDAWGILDDLKSVSVVVDGLQYWEREAHRLVAAFDFSLIREFTDHPYRLHFPQNALTEILYKQLDDSPLATIHFGHQFKSYVDKGKLVEATFSTADGDHTAEGLYLCGADGVNSKVRQQAGIQFEGKTYDDRFLIVNSDARLERVLPDCGPEAYIFDPEEWVIALQMKSHTRFVFRVAEKEDAERIKSYEEVYRRVKRFIPQISHNILDVSIYEVQQRVADSFVKGRVALVGDAAHVNNPISGQGLNSGIQDAIALAITLDQIINQFEDDVVLEEYSNERRKIIRDYVNPGSDFTYSLMTAKRHHEVASRDASFQRIVTDLKNARNFLLFASMMADRIPQDEDDPFAS